MHDGDQHTISDNASGHAGGVIILEVKNMAKQYSTGLIGLDMRPKRIIRTDYPSFQRQRKRRWLVTGILVILLLLAFWLGR